VKMMTRTLHFVTPAVRLKAETFVKLNEASDTTCDNTNTVAAIQEALLNQDKGRRDRLDADRLDSDRLQYVFGLHFRYFYEQDLSSMTLIEHDVYYPSTMVAHASTSGDNATDVCEMMYENGPEAHACSHGFDSFENCTTRISSLPQVTVSERGIGTSDGDSLACRNLHASLATKDPTHCPHLSLTPLSRMRMGALHVISEAKTTWSLATCSMNLT